MSLAHLVKKNSRFVDDGFLKKKTGIAAYCESRVNGNPNGHRMQPGDSIYFAETGYAIYATGTVHRVKDVARIYSLEDLFQYCQTSAVESSKYWFSIANEKIFLRNDFRFLSIFEYEAKLKALDSPIPIPPKFKGQSSYYELRDGYTFDVSEKNLELSSAIPSALRLQLFYKWNVGHDRPMIDIDHFVPQSLGGPGNIEENLFIVGLSINRRKGNAVPRGVYIVGKAFCEAQKVQLDIPQEFISASNPLENSPAGKDIARKIISLVNSDENSMDVIKRFYADVKCYHTKSSVRCLGNECSMARPTQPLF
jgi:hypothetical protein